MTSKDFRCRLLVKRSATTALPWITLLFGLLTALMGAAYFLRSWKTTGPEFLGSYRLGAGLFSVIAGLYLSFVAVDHMRFVWLGTNFTVGLTFIDAIAEATGNKDLPACPGAALVRTETDTALYRCSTDFVFGSAYLPIFAWPSYSSGESVKLKQALEQLRCAPIFQKPSQSLQRTITARSCSGWRALPVPQDAACRAAKNTDQAVIQASDSVVPASVQVTRSGFAAHSCIETFRRTFSPTYEGGPAPGWRALFGHARRRLPGGAWKH